MSNKSKIYAYMLLILFTSLFSHTTQGQVTIGSTIAPNKGALLDLKQFPSSETDKSNATKGLLLPRVNLESTDQLPPQTANFSGDDAHVGLLVFNLREEPAESLCKGVHIWDGTKWINLSNRNCGICEYSIIGHDGVTYYLPCAELEGTQSQAVNICENQASYPGKTYHLITKSEYNQIWDKPTIETGNRLFVNDNSYYLSYLEWITAANIDSNNSAIIGVGFPFSGGAPIGGSLVGKKIVRCVRK